MSKEEDKSIRVIVFSGKKVDWPIWEEKFLARARRKNYKDLLLGKRIIPKEGDTIDITTDVGKKLKQAREDNELAFEDIVLSIDGTNKEGRIAFQIVKGCKSTDFPDGNASIAWTRLKAKYASTTAPSLLKQKHEYDQSRIKPGQDPDEWITNLEEQRARLKEMNFNITDEDFEIHVLNNLSDAYDIEVSRMEDKLEAGSLTIDKMRESLSL